MAPKQDPKPKFQEGNDLSVLISDRSLPPVRLEAAANIRIVASLFYRCSAAAFQQLKMLAFIVA